DVGGRLRHLDHAETGSSLEIPDSGLVARVLAERGVHVCKWGERRREVGMRVEGSVNSVGIDPHAPEIVPHPRGGGALDQIDGKAFLYAHGKTRERMGAEAQSEDQRIIREDDRRL